MLSNKKLNLIKSELLIRGRKLNASLIFITQSYFFVPKKISTILYRPFYYENSKQARASTNSI